MKQIFYLYESGLLKKKDDSLVLISKGNNLFYMPIEQIYSIMCYADITLNKRVISLLNKKQISLHFLNYYGKYIGRYIPKKHGYGKVLIEQVWCFLDVEKKLYIAKALTTGYIKNMQSLILYYCKKYHMPNLQNEFLMESLEKVELSD